jgi:hypothetical protein
MAKQRDQVSRWGTSVVPSFNRIHDPPEHAPFDVVGELGAIPTTAEPLLHLVECSHVMVAASTARPGEPLR